MSIFKKKEQRGSIVRKRHASVDNTVDHDVVWYCDNVAAHLILKGDTVPAEELSEVDCVKKPMHKGDWAYCPVCCQDVQAKKRKLQFVTSFHMKFCRDANGNKVTVSPDKIKSDMAKCPICHMWEDVVSERKSIGEALTL